jgi:hypothetical protein
MSFYLFDLCVFLFCTGQLISFDYISQPSSNSILPLAGLHYMPQCQVSTFRNFCLHVLNPNEWCMKNGFPSGG